jgi:hypothetical protein
MGDDSQYNGCLNVVLDGNGSSWLVVDLVLKVCRKRWMTFQTISFSDVELLVRLSDVAGGIGDCSH